MLTVLRSGVMCATLLTSQVAVLAQSNPCLAAPATVADPTRFYIQASELHAIDSSGAPVITGVQVGVFMPGVDPDTAAPVSPLVLIAASAFKPVPGVPGCCQGPVTDSAPEGVQLNVEYVIAARYSDGIQFGPWTVSNRFLLRRAPSTPRPR